MYYYIFIFCKQQICTRQIGSVPTRVAWRGVGTIMDTKYDWLAFLFDSCTLARTELVCTIHVTFFEILTPLPVIHLTPHPAHLTSSSLKYAVPMFLSALTDVVADPSQFLPSLFLPPALLGVRLPPHGLALLLSVGGTSVAARARHPHLVSAAQHRAMFLLTSRVTVLKCKAEITSSIYDPRAAGILTAVVDIFHIFGDITLHEQVTHFITPQGITFGCQDSPFS